MATDANRPASTERSQRPVRWWRVLALLALGGLALTAGAQQLGREFRKYLAFTTADVDGLLPLPPDRRSAVTRATVRTEHVYSPGCGEGVAYCTEPEGEPVKLPRSVTFEFPTELVSGVDKNSKSVALRIKQSWFSPSTWVPKPVSQMSEAEARKEVDDLPARARRSEASMRYADVLVGLGNYISPSYQRRYYDRSDPPPCAVTCDGSGQVTVRHPPGYNLSDPATRFLQCKSLVSFETAFTVRRFDERGAFQYEIKCGLPNGLCDGHAFFEDWFLHFQPPYDPQVKFPDIYGSLVELFERSVVARSYERPGGSR